MKTPVKATLVTIAVVVVMVIAVPGLRRAMAVPMAARVHIP